MNEAIELLLLEHATPLAPIPYELLVKIKFNPVDLPNEQSGRINYRIILGF